MSHQNEHLTGKQQTHLDIRQCDERENCIIHLSHRQEQQRKLPQSIAVEAIAAYWILYR